MVNLNIKCSNENCEKRFACYRFSSRPKYKQKQELFQPLDGKCSFFWPFRVPLNLIDIIECKPMQEQILFEKVNVEAKIPTRAMVGDVGFDLYSVEEVHIFPGKSALIQTGIATAIPEGYGGFIWPRSGLSAKHQVDVLAGVIDQSYRGEIMVALINHSNRVVKLQKFDRIAQLCVSPVLVEAKEVSKLPEGARGDLGFGSSGS